MTDIFLRQGAVSVSDVILRDPTTSGAPVLVIANATQTQTADNIALLQHNILSVLDALQAQTADNLDLLQHAVLLVDSTVQLQTAENLDLIQKFLLSVANATHAQTADNLDLIFSGGSVVYPAPRIFYSRATQYYINTGGKKIDVNPRPKEKVYKAPLEEPPVAQMFIQGKKATTPEWRIGKALDKMGLTYRFQYSILGGRNPGGQVLDYYIYTVPIPTPLNVNGDYWHRLSKNYTDALKANQTNELFNNSANPLVIAWEHDLGSIDQAEATLKRLLGGW